MGVFKDAFEKMAENFPGVTKVDLMTLLGLHTIGAMREENSGFKEGPWVGSDTVINDEYVNRMHKYPWTHVPAINSCENLRKKRSMVDPDNLQFANKDFENAQDLMDHPDKRTVEFAEMGDAPAGCERDSSTMGSMIIMQVEDMDEEDDVDVENDKARDCLSTNVNVVKNGEIVKERQCLRGLPVDITAWKDLDVYYNSEYGYYGYSKQAFKFKGSKASHETNPHNREAISQWKDFKVDLFNNQPNLKPKQGHEKEFQELLKLVADTEGTFNVRNSQWIKDVWNAWDKMVKNGYRGDFEKENGDKKTLYANDRHAVIDACLQMYSGFFGKDGNVVHSTEHTQYERCFAVPFMYEDAYNENEDNYDSKMGMFSSVHLPDNALDF